MRMESRAVMMSLFAALVLQSAVGLDLPWEKKDSTPGAATEPKPTIKIPASDSDMFPKMKANYVGGKTLQIDALAIAVPAGWYRAEKRDEDEGEAYMFACAPDGKNPVCLLRIEYDINEMERGAAQIPDFLKISRKLLEEDGQWKYEQAAVGGRQVQSLRNTDTGDETLLLVQYALKTYVPSIYILIPKAKAPLAPEAAAFIAGITQGKEPAAR